MLRAHSQDYRPDCSHDLLEDPPRDRSLEHVPDHTPFRTQARSPGHPGDHPEGRSADDSQTSFSALALARAYPLALDSLALAAAAFAAFSLGAGKESAPLLLASGAAAASGVATLALLGEYARPADDRLRRPLMGAAAAVATALPIAAALIGWWPALGVTPLTWAWACLGLLAIRHFRS